MNHHIFYSSYESWLAHAWEGVKIYAMPLEKTVPNQHIAIVYSNIVAAYISHDLVHHVILKIAERTEPDNPERKQQQVSRAKRAWQAFQAAMQAKGASVMEAMVAYPKDLCVCESYFPFEELEVEP